MRGLITRLVLLLAVSVASANTYTVRNRRDSGLRSLRWAIEQANAHVGQDRIRFAPPLTGVAVLPLTPLPPIADDRTTINGDINGDGMPDIAVNGKRQNKGDGLQIKARGCKIIGLAINNSPRHGILAAYADGTVIRSCHIGVDLAGTRALGNGEDDIHLYSSRDCVVGGTSSTRRNVIAGGDVSESSAGLYIRRGDRTRVVGNYFGVAADGSTALGGGAVGIWVDEGVDNVFGGETAAERNLFGGLTGGIRLWYASDTQILGNYFGLATDANAVLPMESVGVSVGHASKRTLIGGTRPGARNVFAGNAKWGVYIFGDGTRNNRVRGNYFGTNASGTRQRFLKQGVAVVGGAGAQVIGGSRPSAGNYFAQKKGTVTAYGVSLAGGEKTVVQNNRFGIRPNGRDAPGLDYGIVVWNGLPVSILDNAFRRARCGVRCTDRGPGPVVLGNAFRRCETGVQIYNHCPCVLGNLTNARTDDDGGNVFRNSTDYDIRNQTPSPIRAEGNNFGTTVGNDIDDRIEDDDEDPSYGAVDFDPLIGGVHPSSSAVSSALALNWVAAFATEAGGTQITFSLSSAAQVQARILNIAGRPVDTLCHARECEAGTNTLLWNAESDQGLAVPNGMYLVEVNAKAGDGAQARALGQVRISR